MSLPTPVLAVDGGGTKTLALLADSRTDLLGLGRGGASNWQTVGVDAMIDSLTQALAVVKNHRVNELSCAVFGLAGIDTDQDQAFVQEIVTDLLRRLGIRTHELVIKNDGEITLLGALPGQPGILVLAGTGSIIYGSDGQGKLVRIGGWGHRLGEEGSAFDLGHQALVAIVRSMDGREPAPGFCQRLFSSLKVNDVAGLKDWVYEPTRTASDIAALAPAVLAAAAEGEQTALQIVRRAVAELMLAVRTAHRQLHLKEKRFSVVLQGGLFQNSPLYRKEFISLLTGEFPQAAVVSPQYQPVVGAVYVACQKTGLDTGIVEAIARHPDLACV